ncbi:MAG: TIM barrel protein [Balneolaceae bacterium]
MTNKIYKRKDQIGLSRREFMNKTAAMATGLTLAGSSRLFGAPAMIKNSKKTGSVINGVEIGVIAPYAFRGVGRGLDVEQLLNLIVELGINAVEMQSPPVEEFAGISSDNQVDWRVSADMDKFHELRRMYNDSGVRFYAYKQALRREMSDAEFDYTFNVAKALGANQVTMELPGDDNDGSLTNRIGQFAAKHQIMATYHNHTQANFNFWDRAIWQSKYNGLNLDTGHYVSANGADSLMDLLDKHWGSIGSLHLKDRKENLGDNMPWGEGDTPIVEVLQLMRDKKANFQATIELEYNVPDDSDPLQEIAKCFEYCRRALTA